MDITKRSPLRIMIFIFTVVIQFSIVHTARNCGRIPPFLHRMRNGVDITILDLLPEDVTKNDGFKKPIIDFTCENKLQQEIDGVLYEVPDQVWSIADIPSGWLHSHIKIFKNSKEVRKSMGASLDVSHTAGIFSSSGSYKTMQGSLSNSSKYLEEVTSYTSGYKVNIMPYWLLEIGRGAKVYIDKYLPTNFTNSTALKFSKFIKYFGTHYFNQGKYGGVLKLLLATNKDYYSSKSDREVRVEAEATFFSTVKVGGGFSHSSRKVDTAFTESTKSSINYYGGNTNLLASGGISKWQPSVAKNPWLFGGMLTAIYDLTDDVDKRNSMKRAVQVHLDKAYLLEMQRVIGSHLGSGLWNRYTKDLMSYREQVNTLYREVILDHSEVLDLTNNILQATATAVPNWFYKVQFCYSWYPDGDGDQCGGGASRLLCANVNAMTEYYRDDTDGRYGGCMMSWSLRAIEYDDWFAHVKICFQWRPQGNEGEQCGGGASRLLCASINSNTSVYLDNTDSYGGCFMQWKLVIPEHAPLWLKNVQLCFEWYPDGDRGQCGGGAPRKLCAHADSYTQAYRDNTDKRRGGCRMRWGLIL